MQNQTPEPKKEETFFSWLVGIVVSPVVAVTTLCGGGSGCGSSNTA